MVARGRLGRHLSLLGGIRIFVLVGMFQPVDPWRGSLGSFNPSLWYYACPKRFDGCTTVIDREEQATKHNWPRCEKVDHGDLDEVHRPGGD